MRSIMRYPKPDSVSSAPLFASAEVRGFLIVGMIMEVLALPLGWLNAGRTNDWPTEIALLYWIGASPITLIAYEVATRAACVILKPWQPALWVVLLAGAILGTPLLELGKHLYVDIFQTAFVARDLWRPFPSTSPATVAQSQIVNILMWLLINGALVRYHGVERFGYRRLRAEPSLTEPAAPTAPDSSNEMPAAAAAMAPAFAARIKKPIGRLWALVAEEHYLRVIGEEGEDLILYRISDAVSELGGREDGARVHRSYWVARAGIERTDRTNSGPILVLRNGMRIPVSRSYRAAAVEAGLLWIEPPPVSPPSLG
jgi:hypothetical protein